MKATRIIILSLLALGACKNFDDSSPANLTSFIRVYEDAVDAHGKMAIQDQDGGYLVAGDLTRDLNHRDIIIFKTDPLGNKQWEAIIPNGIVNAIYATDDGYLIAGDSIQYDPVSSTTSEIENTYARLIKMDKSGNIVGQFVKTDSLQSPSKSDSIQSPFLHIDYHGSAVNQDDQGNTYFLGSYKEPTTSSYERSFVAVLDNSMQLTWIQSYQLQNRDYKNCPSISIAPDGSLLWASNSYKSAQNLESAYNAIVYVKPNSTFKNWGLFGQNEPRNHTAADIKFSGAGYGVVGTYAENSGQNANIYFVRVSLAGSVISGSERYFDGVDIELTDRDQSKTQDEGNALAPAYDGGYVLAGSTTSTPTKGNGGEDILLIKVDAFGNFLWSSLIGGSGDEFASSISETTDHGLLICGSNTISGLSTIVLIKTDRNGQLKN